MTSKNSKQNQETSKLAKAKTGGKGRLFLASSCRRPESITEVMGEAVQLLTTQREVQFVLGRMNDLCLDNQALSAINLPHCISRIIRNEEIIIFFQDLVEASMVEILKKSTPETHERKLRSVPTLGQAS